MTWPSVEASRLESQIIKLTCTGDVCDRTSLDSTCIVFVGEGEHHLKSEKVTEKGKQYEWGLISP